MLIVCPDCGADGQEVGKFCDNCGRLLSEADATAPAGSAVPPAADPVSDPGAVGVASPDVPASPAVDTSTGAGVGVAPTTAAAPAAGAHFAVIRDGQPSALEGFTIARTGEFLVGRPDMETGTPVDIDVRQWVQPLDVQGQKMYLVHRRQCYLGLAQDGTVTIRACPGSEDDTLLKPAGESTFTALRSLGTLRAPGSDGSFQLQQGDQVYMGDPEGVLLHQSGDPTAKDSYLVLELVRVSQGSV
ncbi:MAG TPA: hypothetical protein VEX13_01225 [Chloroflexia bacterium]|nr:hypothetical protein [Chloroflexia bacterium]